MLDPDARRARGRVGDQLGTLGHARHPQPRLGQPARGRDNIRQDRARLRIDDYWHAERRGDRIDGDVVVCRADPAGREQIIVPRAKRVHRVGDALDNVRDDPHLGEPDALIVEPGRDLRDILVLCAARQDLVADHHQRGGPDTLRSHGAPVTHAAPCSSELCT